ncbi:MAG TPA: hypothetical protein VIW70_10600, partial [Rubrivivax sp.]
EDPMTGAVTHRTGRGLGALGMAVVIAALVCFVTRAHPAGHGVGVRLLTLSALLAGCALAFGAALRVARRRELQAGGALPLAAGAILQLSLQTVALVAGYRFFFVLQRHAGPVAFSLVGYGMTLAGMAGTALLFDEHPSADALRAIALVAAALWFSAQTFETPAVRLCPPAAPLPAWNEAIDCTAAAGSCAPCVAA